LIDKDTGPNRRDFIIATAGVLAGGTAAADAREADPLGPGFDLQPPLRANWHEQLGAVVHVDYDLDAKELKDPAEQERHRIYCYHLMKLMCRFCNDNKNGPFGIYPQRDRQIGRTEACGRRVAALYRRHEPDPDRDRPN
jgi:hypothetical protein